MYYLQLLFFICFSLIWCPALSRVEITKDIDKFSRDVNAVCGPKHGVTPEDTKSYDINNKDPKFMCYMKCILEEVDMIGPGGTIIYDHVIEQIHEKYEFMLSSAKDNCQQIKISNCEDAYDAAMCIRTQHPEIWFLP